MYIIAIGNYVHNSQITSFRNFPYHQIITATKQLSQGWKWVRWLRLSGSLGSLFSGLISKLNHLDVTRILIDHMLLRKRYWYLISEWTLGLVNALNHHWYETSYYLKLFWDFILKNSVHGTSSVSCTNLWHCFISDFPCHFT